MQARCFSGLRLVVLRWPQPYFPRPHAERPPHRIRCVRSNKQWATPRSARAFCWLTITGEHGSSVPAAPAGVRRGRARAGRERTGRRRRDAVAGRDRHRHLDAGPGWHHRAMVILGRNPAARIVFVTVHRDRIVDGARPRDWRPGIRAEAGRGRRSVAGSPRGAPGRASCQSGAGLETRTPREKSGWTASEAKQRGAAYVSRQHVVITRRSRARARAKANSSRSRFRHGWHACTSRRSPRRSPRLSASSPSRCPRTPAA